MNQTIKFKGTAMTGEMRQGFTLNLGGIGLPKPRRHSIPKSLQLRQSSPEPWFLHCEPPGSTLDVRVPHETSNTSLSSCAVCSKCNQKSFSPYRRAQDGDRLRSCGGSPRKWTVGLEWDDRLAWEIIYIFGGGSVMNGASTRHARDMNETACAL